METFFQIGNSNTDRGYFSAQASSDSFKEGFEIGLIDLPQKLDPRAGFNRGEANGFFFFDH